MLIEDEGTVPRKACNDSFQRRNGIIHENQPDFMKQGCDLGYVEGSLVAGLVVCEADHPLWDGSDFELLR